MANRSSEQVLQFADQSSQEISESSTFINSTAAADMHSVSWSQLYCHWIPLVVLLLDHYAVFAAMFIIVPLYTENETTTGYLIFVLGFTNLFSGFFAGQISQKYGCVFILIMSVIVRSVGYSLLFFCYDTYQYSVWYISLALLGTSQNFSMQGTATYSAQYVPNNKRGRFNTSIMGFRRLSFFIGSLIAGYLIYNQVTPPNYYRNNRDEFRNDSFVAWKNSYRDLNIFKRCCSLRLWIAANTEKMDNSVVSFVNVFKLFYKQILLITLFTFGLTYARTARRIIITFQGQHINLNAKNIGFINAISYIPDSLLFPVAGYVMDHCGRKYNAVICMFMFCVAMLSISYCNTFDYLIYNSLLWGVADGIASGLTMTIGTDLSPIKFRNQFYSIYRMFENISNLAAPIIVGYLSNEINIRFASYISAIFTVISLIYALIMTEPALIAEKYQQELEYENAKTIHVAINKHNNVH